MNRFSFFSLLFFLFAAACTPPPATTQAPDDEAPTTVSKPAAAGEELSPCNKFSDAPNPDQAETDYVVYRQFIKSKEMNEALKNWRKVYAVAPAADGRRSTVFTDGIALYNHLIQQNPEKREIYGDSILALYAEARRCYPGNGYMAAIQGFDSYYTYPGTATDEEIYALFKESMEIDGTDKLQYFVINPMANLTVKRHKAGEIDDAEARQVVDMLQQRLQKGLAECEGRECDAWNTINNYTPDALLYFETVDGFFDCAYYTERYYQDYLDNPDDCDAITLTYAKLRKGGCAENSEQYQTVQAAYREKCKAPPTASADSPYARGRTALEDGRYKEAATLMEQAADEGQDPSYKSKLYLFSAKIYFSHLRNFSQARALARQAADADPGSGEPYLLIGTLYASSGPLCGPGTGFDSQVVTWVAIDKWQQAKRIQPSLAGEANKLINRYTQYMPSRSDIFQRGLKEGETYRVGCWIQESTRIRAA